MLKQKKLAKQVNGNLQVEGMLPDEIIIAEVLKARGYKTAMFGKWYLGDKSSHLLNDDGTGKVTISGINIGKKVGTI